MSKSLRWSEKWFRRGLWLVAFAFAWFLIGLGGAVVGDLPNVEHRLTQEDFLDKQAAGPLRMQIEAGERQRNALQDELKQARLQQQAARQASLSARETFANWVATRRATSQPDQDAALIERSRQLDALMEEEKRRDGQVLGLEKQLLDLNQVLKLNRTELSLLERDAGGKLESAMRKMELRVFLYRLALTLPLLVIAGWLFVRKRNSTYWPFAWGFIFFALFAFFVELVPYLPSYGGYVRYTVGIVLTVLLGRQAIVALNRYLQRQQQAEQLSDAERRRTLDYDLAQARLAKQVCPGCERSVDLKDGKTDFCPHCGIGLFQPCPACHARRSTFAHYCHACGAAGGN
ncbi:hypothetical protein PIGHUM_03465 [Pigmentiphaga humi]|uniref:Double zinc ribbon n=1 Tax=Pigmentiphaga humi TaxID=2478468 RepID=A0A3P4B5P8_9BURK|nr:zinc ribbon domain-containing protein [Pigmentiphaga humi]VCU71382.1 hypothetical protein PIGHUM_03465 [Pigmentiphaga humi]